MPISTYVGTLRDGKVEISEPIDLPDGSEVSVVVPSLLDKQSARRKANGWLISDVAYMLLAQHGELQKAFDRLVWQFEVFVTSSTSEPRGPIGQILVDASTGHVLDSEQTKQNLIRHVAHPA